ncbi:nitrate- and nitrite sensing domain-containing protein [Streptomyces sp. NPDC088116]|uniref:nitrate- and nitrite sensing domain-containing protein n=1 Tax=Streptomyces sp. NPDC088116 TaxID=3365825 RepID=UPI00382BE109
MRAPVQKKRPRGNGVTHGEATTAGTGEADTSQAGTTGTGTAAGTGTDGTGAVGTGTPRAGAPGAGTAGAGSGNVPGGRRVRVRNRLVAGVAVLGVTVVAAGSPAVLSASTELNDAQSLVNLAELNRQAVTLTQSLADERDEVIVYIAAGRDEQPGGRSKGKYQLSETRSARVDRKIDEIRDAASVSPGLLHDLSTVPSIRRTALTGKGSAMEAYRAYSEVIAKLQTLADELAENTPAEAADGSRAAGALGRAVEQASATRGLLLAALAVPSGTAGTPTFDPVTGLPVTPADSADSKKKDQLRDELSADAQKSRVRELAALADFDQTANTTARDSLSATVTGPDVKTAEAYLTQLTDRPELSASDRGANQEKVEAALSARIDHMRGVESGLGSGQVERLEKLRDDAVTGLELRIALLGGCLLIAVGVSAAVARTLTRPLAVVRIGAARLAGAPGTEEPIRFTGRNDEFAQVVRSVNSLHGTLAELSTRTEKLDSDRTDLIGARQKVADQRAELQEQVAELTTRLGQLRHTVHHTFVNLSLRTLGLVERQLGVIEGLEDREQDPERLATLFKLDHMATVMRRHSENLLVLAGHDHGHGPTGPVPLVDVLRASVSEIERYERVTIQSLPPHAQVVGFAADDLSHLVAELLENATAFSPPDAEVRLSGWLMESGEVMLSVQDQGIGMSGDRLTALNARLADPDTQGNDGAEGEGLGLRVAALLAARHGVRVELREHHKGGVAAVVVLPQALLPEPPSAAVPPPAPTANPLPAAPAPAPAAPEAGADALPKRSASDPLVAAAEAAIRRSEAKAAAEAKAAEAAETQAAAVTQAAQAPEVAAEASSEPVEESEARPGPYAIGPDSHARVPDGEPETTGTDQDTFAMRLPSQPRDTPPPAGTTEVAPDTGTDAGAGPDAVGAEGRVTDKGLPKRTPKIVEPATAPTGRSGGVDAEALRRRLGGFHQGAKEGRRDVEAELTDQTDQADQPDRTDQADRTDQTDRIDQTDRTGTTGQTELTDRSGLTQHTASTEQTDVPTEATGETVEEARS